MENSRYDKYFSIYEQEFGGMIIRENDIIRVFNNSDEYYFNINKKSRKGKFMIYHRNKRGNTDLYHRQGDSRSIIKVLYRCFNHYDTYKDKEKWTNFKIFLENTMKADCGRSGSAVGYCR